MNTMFVYDKNPKWWLSNINTEFHLLKAYVDQLEDQLFMSQETYEKFISTATVIRTYENDVGGLDEVEDEINHVNGISEDDFDLKGLYEEYFPNIQRRSSLITIYALFEKSLKEFSDILIEVRMVDFKKKYVQKPSDIKEAQDKLVIGCGLDLSEAQGVFHNLEVIRMIRHVCAHGHGEVGFYKDDKLQEIIEYIEATDFIRIEGMKVYIAPGFLSHIIDLSMAYFSVVKSRL
jgi:hypothetical protein